MKIEHLKNTTDALGIHQHPSSGRTKVHKIVITHKDRQQRMIIAKGDHYKAVILLEA